MRYGVINYFLGEAKGLCRNGRETPDCQHCKVEGGGKKIKFDVVNGKMCLIMKFDLRNHPEKACKLKVSDDTLLVFTSPGGVRRAEK